MTLTEAIQILSDRADGCWRVTRQAVDLFLLEMGVNGIIYNCGGRTPAAAIIEMARHLKREVPK